jgi:Protein of unknown function (DUF3043)
VPSLFSRKPAEPAVEDAPEPEDVVARSRSYTPSKKDQGKVTPKRAQGGRKVEPPPANRREAVKRQREKQRQGRIEARAGMMAGKDEYLPKRDQGPERSLARDVVDSRRNVASYFIPVAVILLISTMTNIPLFRYVGNVLTFAMIAAVIADSYFLTRRLKKAMHAKFPKTPARLHYSYAILRSLSIRKWRIPGPKVKLGQKI